ncbi:family 1 glycosylhydrolase [Geodermatophilus sp. URMC 62]|uniref:family 1 glycosylhydrolase n=1 Tax=Geodermatophilus sp. URMC 62 TaxID=3423414 RepID=UPI00406BEFB1
MTAAQFPEGFLWGAATAAHQVEGGNVNNDHWEAEHAAHSPFAEPSGDACDSWHRWPEDLDLVAGAGLDAYRFSLEWSRVEPDESEFSRAALDHYRRVLDGCRDRGPAPVVTLVHFTMPRWLHDGGWTGPKTGDRLARFAEFALPVLAEAEYACTLDEPDLMATQPVTGAMARRGEEIRGLPGPDQEVADALLGLHGRTMEVPRGNVRRAGMTLVGGEHLAEAGGEERMHEERAAVARAAEVLPDTPLVVTENGIATADDADRIAFTTDALAAAIDAGADVRGYLPWSLLDEFEWMLGYRPTFGLVAVDRQTFARWPKSSLAWLGGVAHRNGIA